MGLFSFGKKVDLSKDYSLPSIPLFANLSSGEIKTLEKYVRLLEAKKGDIIYDQGSDSDAFYVIISGRFRVLQRTRNGDIRTVAYYHRGDYFGEISLLTEKSHSVTVQAINDALLFKIEKADFLKILSDMPPLSFHLNRSLSLRLKQRDEAEKVGGSKIVSISSLGTGMGKTTFVVNLASSLFHHARKKVVVVDISERAEEVARGMLRLEHDQKFLPLELSKANFDLGKVIQNHISSHQGGFDVVYLKKEDDEIQEAKIISLLTFLLIHYDVVLVDLPIQLKSIALKILSQSDTIYLLSGGQDSDLRRVRTFARDLESTYQFVSEDIRLIVVEEEKRYEKQAKEMEQIASQKVFALLPFVSDMKNYPVVGENVYVVQKEKESYSRVVRYLARELTGALVGLVLGSGAAFGFAHIGVLRVLERERIPIDIIAGSSIGALIGALWASGYNSDDLEKLANSFDRKSAFLNLLGTHDFSPAHQGFFKGLQIHRYLKSLLGEKTFQDLNTPMRIVATDLFTSQEIVFDEGPVASALRASISIPGIFRPYQHNGRYLIDGGVIDPLPVKVLTRMGVSKIISVNVLSGMSEFEERKILMQKRTERLKEELKTKTKFWDRLKLRFKIYMREHYSANIFNVLMQSMQFMESNIAQTAEQESDVYIKAVVTDAHWAEFYSAEKFISEGELRTLEKMEEIKNLVKE